MTVITDRSLSSELIQSGNQFLMDLYMGETYLRGLIYGSTFASGVFHTCYLYPKKEEWNKTKSNALVAKCPFTT